MKRGRHSATIPHRRLFYAIDAEARWSAMWEAWIGDGRKTPSTWKEFEFLVATPGFQLGQRNGGLFAEAIAALDLHSRGYTCYRACSLFRTGTGKLPEVHEMVEPQLEQAGLPMPRDFVHRTQPRPRNPDLTSVDQHSEWRFSEVKWRRTERLKPGQLVGLAVLQEILQAAVEVVRVVPETDRSLPEPAPYVCHYDIS